jgi:thiosulfate/3-mercaptopyruvate sulfurtransferase
MHENAVVGADWLADRLDGVKSPDGSRPTRERGGGRGDVRVVDVREPWEYDGIGHVPGAVNVPFDEFRSEGHEDEGMLPGADRWATLLGEAGISAEDTIVAYDDTHGVFAARFLVTAELYGHKNLHLLDGDFSSWMREREVESEAPDVEPATYEVRDPEDSPLVSREEVEEAMDDPDAVLVDTREDWEFEEGHVPGAQHLDWKELVDVETRGLKHREELEEILESYGITPDKRIVLYCNTARRISHTYVVLSSLGYDDLAFYEGSLTEWEKVGGPIETGS